jgi:glycosyltransferase involved in cell wall biosynthesis
MRVLVLINRFPPHHGGGYGLRFGEIVGELRRKGHRVSVVTSTTGVGRVVEEESGVYRALTPQPEIHGARAVAAMARDSFRDGRRLRRALRRERPDVVLVGNFFGLSSALWNVLRAWGAPLVLDVSNEWLLDLAGSHGNWFRIWEKPSARARGAVLKGLARRALDAWPGGYLRTRFPGLGASRIYATAPHMIEDLKRAAVVGDVPLAVCPSGIVLDDFPFRPSDRPMSRLLYVGRLKAVKGVHTAIEAVAALPPTFRLTIVGLPDDAEYAGDLKRLAARPDVEGRVTFADPVPRADLVRVFHEHDVLVFPTVWAEPFSRLILEAFACGLPVVATPTGGTPEAVRDGTTGLFFPPEDADALAERIRTLADDAALRGRLIEEGRRLVVERFELRAAVGRIESLLADVVRESAGNGCRA